MGLCLIALLTAVSIQIVGRHVFHATPAWTEVFASLMMTWLSFLGAAYAVRADEHMAITVLPSLLKGWMRSAILALISLAGLIFSVYLLRASLEQLSLLGNSTIIGLDLSTRWLFLSATASSGLMVLFLIERLLLSLTTREGPVTGNEAAI